MMRSKSLLDQYLVEHALRLMPEEAERVLVQRVQEVFGKETPVDYLTEYGSLATQAFKGRLAARLWPLIDQEALVHHVPQAGDAFLVSFMSEYDNGPVPEDLSKALTEASSQSWRQEYIKDEVKDFLEALYIE